MADDSAERLRSKGEDGGEGVAPAPKIEGDDEITVPVRKTSLHNLQGFAMRKAKEAERAKTGEGGEDAPPAGDDDELTPEASKHIEKVVDKFVAPLRDAIVSKTDDDELRNFYAKEPEAEKHDRVIKKYMEVHPTATPEMIYHHIAFEEAAKAGSKKRQVADLDAEMSAAGGNPRRDRAKGDDVPDFDSMDDKEFTEYQNKVRQKPPAQKPKE